MSGAIDRYLLELSRRLPPFAHRLLEESAEHLHDARDRFLAEGMTLDDAERRAVEEYGSVSEVVAAVSENGGPRMSPHARRFVAAVSFLMTLPTLIFVGVNAIEQLAGNSGGIGVFGSTFDPWQVPINLFITFGPAAGLLLVALASVRVRISGERGAREATLHIRLSRPLVIAGVIAALTTAAVFGYLITENVVCMNNPWAEIC